MHHSIAPYRTPLLSDAPPTAHAGNRTDKHAVPELIALFRATGSVLLRHEVAYTLGQMRRLDAVPFLEELDEALFRLLEEPVVDAVWLRKAKASGFPCPTLQFIYLCIRSLSQPAT